MREVVTVERPVAIRLVEPPGSMPGRLSYDPADPYAVTLAMLHPDEAVVWAFARDLLIDGLTATLIGPAGVGDVRVWSRTLVGRRHVVVRLSSPNGTLVLAMQRTSVSAFLDETLRLVPRGEESSFLGLDGVVARLLGGGATC